MKSLAAGAGLRHFELSTRVTHVDDRGIDRVDTDDRMATRSKGVPTGIDAKNSTSRLARCARPALDHVQHGLGKRLAVVRRLGQHILDPGGASRPRGEILL